MDALGQFKLETSFGGLGSSVGFTQANLMMVISGAVILALLYYGMKPRAMVPGRLQALAEMSYEGVLNMCTEAIGPEGRAFFPFIFALFFFILFGNMIGIWPYAFAFTSHIAVTGLMAVFVVAMVT